MEKHICNYCKQVAFYQLKNGKWCCSKSANSCPQMKRKNSNGLKKAYINGKRKPMKKIYQQLPQETKNNIAWSRGKCLKQIANIFCKNSNVGRAILKRYILKNKLKENKCEICGINKWNGKGISLHLHHIDGDKTNNTLENIQLLCPNCHSQTDNFCGKNDLNFSLDSLSIEKIREAATKVDNVSSLLIFLGCHSTGKAICEKIKNLMKENNISFNR